MFKTESALRKNFYAAMVVLFAISFAKNDLTGQDIHYSQFYNSPLNINPALTGIFNGDVRVIGSIRDQWRSVVPYTTFSGNYDMKVYTKNRDKGFFGVGAIFNYDQAGDGVYNISDLNLTGSYSFLLNPNNVLTAGVLVGVASEGFDSDGLTWDKQWDGLAFDPNLSSNENFRDNLRFTYLETGVGLNYRFQKSARTNFNLGVGAWHLTTPSSEFTGDINSDLPIRIALNFTGIFKLVDAFDLQLHANHNIQDQYTETVFGGLGRIHINQKPGSRYALDIGASYRMTGFIVPTIALHYNQFYVGASYDITLGDGALLNEHAVWQAGPEVHVRYIITNVKPLSEVKACPIF